MKKGISLILLIITIIVIAIIAGAVILSLSNNSPINSANEAVFKSDIGSIESDLSMYISKQYISETGYNPSNLSANDLTVEYNGTVIDGKTIKDIIPILSSTDKYDGQFEIQNGNLIFVGTNRTMKKWAEDSNVQVIDADRLDATISSLVSAPIAASTDAQCLIKISSNAGISNINLNGNLEVLDSSGVALPIQPVFSIADPSGTSTDTLRSVIVTIRTDGFSEGKYKLKIKSGAISNIYDITNKNDIISDELFEIDNTPPSNPEMSADPTRWTNSDVTVSVTYPTDAVNKEYSLDGTAWNVYTSPIDVSVNNTTVYVKASDIAGNQSGQSTMTIANIDKDSPIVTFETNGGTNLQNASTKVTVSDGSGSGIDSTSLEYVWDTQNQNIPIDGWLAFTNDTTITKSGYTGSLYLWVKALDNVGNIVVSKSNVFEADNTPPASPTLSADVTGWTNGNVTVTITYPQDTSVKEYSLDGTTWNAYTAPIVVSNNNTTVYARAKDASGNQSSQSTMTIANIDKDIPTVAFATNGGSNLQNASTKVTVTDIGGSNLNLGSLQYTWDTQNTVTPGSGWNVFDNNTIITKTGFTGTLYLWIKGSDNAGNNIISKSNAFIADNTPPANPTMSSDITGWTNGNVTVTISYPSDAAIKEYSLDGTTWNAYTSPIVVSNNNTTIYARATDASGNQSGQSTITITNIDKTAPSTPTFMGMTFSDGVTNYTNNTWTANAVYMYGGISGSTDSLSGVSKYQISTDNVNWVDYVYDSSNPVYGITTSGTYYRYARAIDKAGNASASYSRIIKIDTTAPTAFNMTVTKTANSITVSGVTTDNESGISGYYYYINGSWTAITSNTSYTFTGLTPGTTYSIWMTAYNNAGAQTLANGGAINVTTNMDIYSIGNMGTNGYVTIRTPASTSTPTECSVNGVGQGLSSGIHIGGVNIKVGDTISVTYATNRSNNAYYLDLYDNEHSNSGSDFLGLNILYSQNMVTTTKTFSALYNSNAYEIYIYKSNYTNSDIYGTLYIYNISVNGVKVL